MRHIKGQMDRSLFKDASLAENMTVEELLAGTVDEALIDMACCGREK